MGVARLWTLAGLTADLDYRLLGFLIGLGTLGVFWFGARRCGAGVPLLVLALYAANPLAVRTGDAMRPYGLGYALILLALTLTWKFVETPRARSWYWATLAAVLSVQCLYQNAFFVAAFCLAGCAVGLARRQWKTMAQTVGIGLVAALSLLPHWPNIVKGRAWQGINWHAVHLNEIGSVLVLALNASGPWMVWFWAGLALLAIGTAVVLAIRSRAWMKLYFGVVLLAAPLFYGLFLEGSGLQQRAWYLLILMGPAALAVDVILAGLAAPALRLGRTGLALLLAASCVPTGYAAVQVRQSNADWVADTLHRQCRPGDLILVTPWYYGIALQRYCTNHFETIPPMAREDLRIHRYDLMKIQMMAGDPIGPLLEQARQTLRSGHDLWVTGEFAFSPPGQPHPIIRPYREDMALDVPQGWYCSSWMFQFSQMIRLHSTSKVQVEMSVPGGAAVNDFEDMLLLRFSGWKD